MTKTTECHTTRSDSTQKPPFNVVYIAYSEVSVMSGAKDQSTPCGRNGSGEGADREIKEYECMARIAKIPLIESTALVMSNFYSSVKQSHCMVQTMFENVEEGWSKSAEVVSPVTNKIEETLEGPLRVIDSAACVGLDFIEEKLPSVKLPPKEIYENSKDYVNRRVLAPVVEFTCTLLENFKDRLSQYTIRSPGAAADNESGDNCSQDDLASHEK